MKQSPQDSPSDDPLARTSAQTRTITIKLNNAGLIGIILMVLLTGAGIGAVVTNRVGAAPTPQEQLRMSSQANTALALSAAFTAAANEVEACVVHITTVDFDGEGEAFNQSSGSGFVVDPAGYILTNYHVVKDATK